MSWIGEYKTAWRGAALILLLVATMGPWAYGSDVRHRQGVR